MQVSLIVMGSKMITQNFQPFKLISSTPGKMTGVKGAASGLNQVKGGSFSAILGKVSSLKSSSESTSTANNFFSLKTIKGQKENSLIDALMENIQLDGMSPADLEVDSEGMVLLENLLANLGFGEDEIAGFISELTDGGTKEKSSLSGVLTKLNSFLESGDSHDELATSAVPAIASILSAMGVKPEEIETVLYESGGKGGGIDLQNLIAGLKTISSEGGASSELTMNSGNQLLLSALSLSSTEGKSVSSEGKSVSLNQFIEKLEVLANKKGGQVSDGETIDAIAKRFGENIKTAGVKNSGSGLQGETNSFLNSHSFQKQQQVIEENAPVPREGLQSRDSLKPGSVKLMVKDGVAAVNEQSARGSLTAKQEDPGGAVLKMGVATDSMTQKTSSSGIKPATDQPLPSYVTNQVSMKIANAAKNGESTFKIQLKPAEMGRLQISLEFTKTGLKVGILAEHTATRDMLLSNSSELKSILNDQGIRLDKVEVDVSGNFNQSMADARRESNNSGNRDKSKDKTEDLFEQVAVNETIRLSDEAFIRSETGRLSLVV